MLVILNFSTDVVTYELPDGVMAGTMALVISSEMGGVSVKGQSVELQPYSGALYRLGAYSSYSS